MSNKNVSVESCLKLKQLPDYDLLSSLCDKVCTFLENEKTDYRPLDKFGNPGSLIELKKKLPVIVVPDIHARPDFILNILNHTLGTEQNFPKKISVKEALKQGLVYLVCAGDGIHTELTKERWLKIQENADQGNLFSDEMMEEMRLNLASLTALMSLKLEFPEYFHFLKGNHENILNTTGDGDFSFIKYADEGELCKKFISNHYGDDILYLIHYYEKSLPLVACSKSANCVISHAEPAGLYLKSDLIDAHLYPEVVAGLTWTGNDQVKENTASFIIKNLLEPMNCKTAVYFSGHRPVSEKFTTRQNGQFIQIHNPLMQNIAIVLPEEEFNPEKNIISVN